MCAYNGNIKIVLFLFLRVIFEFLCLKLCSDLIMTGYEIESDLFFETDLYFVPFLRSINYGFTARNYIIPFTNNNIPCLKLGPTEIKTEKFSLWGNVTFNGWSSTQPDLCGSQNIARARDHCAITLPRLVPPSPI